MTIWIGLTGGIGSGKSQATVYFSALNVPIISADQVNHQLINTPNSVALQRIQSVFGIQALDGSGCLNRQYMRNLIFHHKQEKQKLEQILHPFIIEGIQQQQQNEQLALYGIVELPTLAEHPHFSILIERVLLIHCDEQQRVERVKQRSGLSEQEIERIISNQASDVQRLQIANDIIDNSGSLKQLQDKVQQQHHFYKQYFGG